MTDGRDRRFIISLSSSESSSLDEISQRDDDSEGWADCQTSCDSPQSREIDIHGEATATVGGQGACSDQVTKDMHSEASPKQGVALDQEVSKPSSVAKPSLETCKSKVFAGSALFGAGFPSGPPPSGNVIIPSEKDDQQLPRYRVASDSEWDAMEIEKKKKAASTPASGPSFRSARRREPSSNFPKNESTKNVKQSTRRSTETASEQRPTYEKQSDQSKRDVEKRTYPGELSMERTRREETIQQSPQNLVYRSYTSNPSRNRRTVSKKDFVNVCRQLIGSESEDEQYCDELDLEQNQCLPANHSNSEECYLPLRPSCASSVLINKFVNADPDAGMICSEVRCRGDSQHIDDLLHNIVHKFFSSTTLSSGALSVVVDLFEFPPTLSSRPSNRLLRPVTIDGCAVSGCFDKEYSVHWGRIKDTRKIAWTPCKVLSMKPIYQCLVEFLLRGHKVERACGQRYPNPLRVTVALPAYYRDASFNDLRSKVDDIEALNVLLNLKIIQFVDNPNGRNIMDEIRAQVDRVDALLVSSGCFDIRDEWQFPSNATFSSTQGGDNSALPTAFTQASKRMLTPIFFGRNQDMTIVYTFSTKEGGTWRSIPEKVLCYYEPQMDSDRNIDDAGRLCQQLLFEEQIKVLVALKDLFEWSCIHRRGISALLRLNFLATMSA